MRIRIGLKFFALWVLISAVLGGALHWLSGMPIWAAMLVSAGALLINGFVAEWEDRRTDGFLNQKETKKVEPDA